MKVLLIATNRHGRYLTNIQAQPLPLGLAYIAGYLDPERHRTKLLDLMFADDYLGDVEKAVKDFSPDCQGRREIVPAGRSKTVPLNAAV